MNDRPDRSRLLRFRSDGTFRIVVFSDCQDNMSAVIGMLRFMGDVLDHTRPDLVVFNGDNVCQPGEYKFESGVIRLLSPVVSRGIPYLLTYGNHDAETFTKQDVVAKYELNKSQMTAVYKRHGLCLNGEGDYTFVTPNGDVSQSEYTVYSSYDQSIPALALYALDSNMYVYDDKTGRRIGTDLMHPDQLDWYERTSDELKSSNGGVPVKGLVFQHIQVPEVYRLFNPAGTTPGTRTRRFNYSDIELSLDPAKASGILIEWTDPGNPEIIRSLNALEYDVFARRRDVIAIVNGHDHMNCFRGDTGEGSGIELISTPSPTINCYGSDVARGTSVLTVHENDLSIDVDTIHMSEYGYSRSTTTKDYHKRHPFSYLYSNVYGRVLAFSLFARSHLRRHILISR